MWNIQVYTTDKPAANAAALALTIFQNGGLEPQPFETSAGEGGATVTRIKGTTDASESLLQAAALGAMCALKPYGATKVEVNGKELAIFHEGDLVPIAV